MVTTTAAAIAAVIAAAIAIRRFELLAFSFAFGDLLFAI
jgi:hypothetical protein